MRYSGGDFKNKIYSHLYDRIKDTAATLKARQNVPDAEIPRFNERQRAKTLKSFTSIANVIKDQPKKKKTKVEDLKISGNSSKTKTKSRKGTSYSGPGDANL